MTNQLSRAPVKSTLLASNDQNQQWFLIRLFNFSKPSGKSPVPQAHHTYVISAYQAPTPNPTPNLHPQSVNSKYLPPRKKKQTKDKLYYTHKRCSDNTRPMRQRRHQPGKRIPTPRPSRLRESNSHATHQRRV